MRTLVYVVLVIAISCGCAKARAECIPGPQQVAFFTDANFAGDCRTLAVGDYPTATSTGLPNDSVSSVRVGSGTQVRVCSDAYFAGTCVLLKANAPYLGNLSIGNDHLTSAKVRPLGASDSPQDFDPRCSDRTAKGKFACTIHKPIISRAEWVYQNVVFAPGDRVFINGDGCVQTGGTGDTWKRYVNPGGGGADHLYHGMVRVPTGKLAGTDVGDVMTRIEHVVGRPITVTGEGVPESQLVLHLGYEDDDYTDNSYDRHDDGTEDQCKGDNGNDGGPAYVTITICRHTFEPCTSMPSRFPFNVLSDQVDPNGFLFNPHWSWQDRDGNKGVIPSGSLCHDFSMRNASTNLGIYNVPNLPDCTDQAGQDTLDVPPDLSVNNVACTWGAIGTPLKGTKAFGGHVNWFPITVEGTANKVTSEFDDDYDFSFDVDGADQASVYLNPGRTFLHAEFDSDETVDNFKSDAWRTFRQAVDGDNAQRAADLFAGHAVATGLFGFDGEHDGKTELHPLYALATNVCTIDPSTTLCKCQDPVAPKCEPVRDPGNDVWLIFVRNRGDEGWCSSQIWAGGFDDYTFRLPWRVGMTDVDVDWDKTQFEGSQGTSDKPAVRVVRPLFVHPGSMTGVVERLPPGISEPPGVYVTFHLGYPTVVPGSDSSASIPYVDGALHLTWKGTDGAAGVGFPPFRGTAVLASDDESKADPDVEDLLSRAVKHLGRKDLEAFKRVVGVQPGARVAQHTPPDAVTRARGTIVAASVARSSPGPRPVAGPAGTAKAKLARDAARLHALCVVTQGKPFGVPESLCKPAAVRDHRHDVR